MNLLWRKERTSANEMHVDIFENQKCSSNQRLEYVNHKCDEAAEAMRLEGNVHFRNKMWTKAMICYNDSLRFAEIRSENAALAYANRASSFLHLKMYNKCLADIELAIFANYPAHLMPKMQRKRKECLNLLKTGDRLEEIIPELSYKPDENFPGMANLLEISYNERYGRHIVAKCDIEVGKTVLLEEAFVIQKPASDVDYQICETCMKPFMNFIACNRCSNALFCSTNCMQMNKLHKFECQLELSDDTRNDMRVAFLAISIFPNADDLMEFVEDSIKTRGREIPQSLNDVKSKFRTFLQLSVLKSAKKQENLLDMSYKIYMNLLSHDIIGLKFDTKKKRNFLKHLVTHNRSLLQSNNFGSRSHMPVFINFCYLNHSCAPNLSFAYWNNQLVGITVRPVRKGQQLFTNYVQSLSSEMPLLHFNAARQQGFLNVFGFQCTCEKCKSNKWPQHNSHFASDPEYIVCKKELEKYMEFRDEEEGYEVDRKESLFFQNKCIGLLKKYGNDKWSMETEDVFNFFTFLQQV